MKSALVSGLPYLLGSLQWWSQHPHSMLDCTSRSLGRLQLLQSLYTDPLALRSIGSLHPYHGIQNSLLCAQLYCRMSPHASFVSLTWWSVWSLCFRVHCTGFDWRQSFKLQRTLLKPCRLRY